MAYFQIQHKKVKGVIPEQWQYDYWLIEGSDRKHLKTRIYDRQFTPEEIDLMQSELQRIHNERKPIIYLPEKHEAHS